MENNLRTKITSAILPLLVLVTVHSYSQRCYAVVGIQLPSGIASVHSDVTAVSAWTSGAKKNTKNSHSRLVLNSGMRCNRSRPWTVQCAGVDGERSGFRNTQKMYSRCEWNCERSKRGKSPGWFVRSILVGKKPLWTKFGYSIEQARFRVTHHILNRWIIFP